jgi:hypothetical protein
MFFGQANKADVKVLKEWSRTPLKVRASLDTDAPGVAGKSVD